MVLLSQLSLDSLPPFSHLLSLFAIMPVFDLYVNKPSIRKKLMDPSWELENKVEKIAYTVHSPRGSVHFIAEGYGNLSGDWENFIDYSRKFSKAQRGERCPVLLDYQWGLSPSFTFVTLKLAPWIQGLKEPLCSACLI